MIYIVFFLIYFLYIILLFYSDIWFGLFAVICTGSASDLGVCIIFVC